MFLTMHGFVIGMEPIEKTVATRSSQNVNLLRAILTRNVEGVRNALANGATPHLSVSDYRHRVDSGHAAPDHVFVGGLYTNHHLPQTVSSPLLLAFTLNELSIMRLLLDHGAELPDPDYFPASSSDYSYPVKGYLDAFRLLFMYGFKGKPVKASYPNPFAKAKLPTFKDNLAIDSDVVPEPLALAAATGNENEVKRLLALKPSEHDLRLALNFAAGQGQLSVVQLLLNVGADATQAFHIVTNILPGSDLGTRALYLNILELLEAPGTIQLVLNLREDSESRFSALPAELCLILASFVAAKQISK